MGISYFEKVVVLQKKYTPEGVRIVNDIQTNGVLVDERWCQFFKQHGFFVGLSLDGPEFVHNHYRKKRSGQGTFDKVMAAVEKLRAYEVPFATLTCVNNLNAEHPLEVYRFLRDVVKPSQIQFIPVVDQSEELRDTKHKWLRNSKAAIIPVPSTTTRWSVEPEQWGRFLIEVFDEWLQHDFGRIHVPYFENFFGIWMGRASTMCTLNDICGKGIAVEQNGDVYACDHYVHPDYKVGNIRDRSLADIAFSQQQMIFGFAKQKALPKQCIECQFRFACHANAPKTE